LRDLRLIHNNVKFPIRLYQLSPSFILFGGSAKVVAANLDICYNSKKWLGQKEVLLMSQSKGRRHYRVAKREKQEMAFQEEKERQVDNFMMFIRVFTALATIITSILSIIQLLRPDKIDE
jgi:ABC-type uncharacterized transport system involved in gliding motility auxiliary subunit